MTSENELDLIKTVDTNENNDISINQPESAVLTNPIEHKTEEGEQINVEKPKRGGRKKRDVTSITDVQSENLNNDLAMDTQPLFEQPVIVEGKRSRKPTSRLELLDLATPKKELSIPQGHGKPLGDIEYINHQITHASTDALSHMRNLCFGRRGSKSNVRQNLREFNGFEFEQDSDEYQRHLSNLIKLKKDQLKSLSDILGLPATGRNNEHAERILNFLIKPQDEGKEIPERKLSMRTAKKASTNSKESIHTDEDENENGDDDDDDEIFNEEDEEDEEGETDDDYIGSDDEGGLITKDDPDDFVYQPGKKTPKKRPSLKRARSRSSQKRKRGTTKTSRRGRKKAKVTPVKKSENIEATVPAESIQTNDEDIEKTKDDHSTTEPKTSDSHTNNSEQNDITTTNNMTSDVISATN